MSTKIYNGYIVEGVRTLAQLSSFVAEVRQNIRTVQQDLFRGLIAEHAIDAYDLLCLGEQAFPAKTSEDAPEYRDSMTVFSAARRRVEHEVADAAKSSNRDPKYDLDFSVCFVMAGQECLALLYTQPSALTRAWEALPQVKEFGYWNNTDRPDSVSPKEWNRRKRLWDQALGEVGIPADVGVSFELASDRLRIVAFTTSRSDWEALISEMSDVQKRVSHLAEGFVHHEKMYLLRDASGRAPDDMDAALDAFFDANRWMRTEEGQAAVSARQVELASRLKPVLTFEDLTQKISDVSQGASLGVSAE